MARVTLDQLTLIDLKKTNRQPFTRKVVVVAYYLKKNQKNSFTPHFLFSVIVPKQSEFVTNQWDEATRFKLPRGFSLIKGTREMSRDGKEQDIPPGFNRYFKTMKIDSLGRKSVGNKAIDSRVDGVFACILSALKESKEEAGIKLKNISLIFDLGVRNIKVDGRNLAVNSYAIELKEPKNGKAIDSLAIEYFTLRELEFAEKQRMQYNIPLARPSHVAFVKETLPQLQQYYKAEGIKLSKKLNSNKNEQKNIQRIKMHFKCLLKDAKKGIFMAHKFTLAKTVKNIIKKSNHSRFKKTLFPDTN